MNIQLWLLVNKTFCSGDTHFFLFHMGQSPESEKRPDLPRNRFQQTQTFLTIAVNFGQNRQDFDCRNKKGGWGGEAVLPPFRNQHISFNPSQILPSSAQLNPTPTQLVGLR